ncbi:MAG TPA: hypothetical protein VKR06_42855 [Ktedonosporobacter sp.]|nr:hypothetical protein [Ktedonosporobacter sp.]
MNIPPFKRLLLEIWWFLLSFCLLAIGWINYNAGKGSWYAVMMIFGFLFLLYSIGSAIYYWRFHQRKER